VSAYYFFPINAALFFGRESLFATSVLASIVFGAALNF